jgi:hypothetical protein
MLYFFSITKNAYSSKGWLSNLNKPMMRCCVRYFFLSPGSLCRVSGQCISPATSLSHSLRHHQHGTGASGGLSRPTPRDDLDLPSEAPLTSDDLYRLSTAGTPTTVTPSPEAPTPPRIIELPVRQHKEVHLNCELVAASNASAKLRASSLMWFHDGQLVDAFTVDKNTRSGSGLGHRYMRDFSTGQLRIANARLEDEGVWHCEERDPITSIVISTGKPTRLVVLGKCSCF